MQPVRIAAGDGAGELLAYLQKELINNDTAGEIFTVNQEQGDGLIAVECKKKEKQHRNPAFVEQLSSVLAEYMMTAYEGLILNRIAKKHYGYLKPGERRDIIGIAQKKLVYDTNEAIKEIFSGSAVFVFELISYAISCKIDKVEKRTPIEPSTEKNIRGPHEGFLEVLESNIGMLRRKIRNDALKFKTVTLGSITNQTVAIAYIEGIANKDLVDGLFEKISSIKLDGMPAIGYIEQSIITHPNSLFPQFLSTERPDKAVAALLEGRIVVLMEGTPVVLIAPVTFISFFQSLDDYST
jgi:hypothetical protein